MQMNRVVCYSGDYNTASNAHDAAVAAIYLLGLSAATFFLKRAYFLNFIFNVSQFCFFC